MKGLFQLVLMLSGSLVVSAADAQSMDMSPEGENSESAGAPADESQEQVVPPQVPLPAAEKPRPEDWTAYGRNNAATRYSPLDEINRENVGSLQRVWTYRTRDMPPERVDGKWAPETTPLKVGESLYMCSATNILMSLDAATGREKWRYDPGVPTDHIPYSASCRGVAYHEAPELSEQAPASAASSRVPSMPA